MEVSPALIVFVVVIIVSMMILLLLLLSKSPKLFCTDATYVDDLIEKVNAQLVK